MAAHTEELDEAISILIRESYGCGDMEDSIDTYRFLVEYRDFDYEDLLNQEWWRICPGASYLQIVQDNLAVPYQDLPWSVRFEHAMVLQDWMHSIEQFLQPLACSPSDARLAKSTTSDGRTVLHAIARAVFRAHIKDTEQWKDMTSAFLANGGQLHHLNNHGQTALAFGLQDRWGRYQRTNTQLQVWVRLLQGIGVNLDAYGQMERALWRYSEYGCEPVIDWEFGSTAHDWVALVSRVARVSVYVLQKIPGAWQSTNYTGPQALPWAPTAEDEPPGDSLWCFDREVRLMSAPSPTSTKFAEGDPYRALLAGTQDDASEVVQLIRTTQRPRLRPRSLSQPHLLGRGCNEYGEPWYYASHRLGYYHFCPRDSKRRLVGRRFLPDTTHRRCMRGIGHNINIEEDIMRRLRNLRKEFSSREELDNLEEEDYAEHGFG